MCPQQLVGFKLYNKLREAKTIPNDPGEELRKEKMRKRLAKKRGKRRTETVEWVTKEKQSSSLAVA